MLQMVRLGVSQRLAVQWFTAREWDCRSEPRDPCGSASPQTSRRTDGNPRPAPPSSRTSLMKTITPIVNV